MLARRTQLICGFALAVLLLVPHVSYAQGVRFKIGKIRGGKNGFTGTAGLFVPKITGPKITNGANAVALPTSEKAGFISVGRPLVSGLQQHGSVAPNLIPGQSNLSIPVMRAAVASRAQAEPQFTIVDETIGETFHKTGSVKPYNMSTPRDIVPVQEKSLREIARDRSIRPFDYTLEEKISFPPFLEKLVKGSLFRVYHGVAAYQVDMMEELFEIFPDKTVPLTKLYKRLGVKTGKIKLAAKNYPEVIQFLNGPQPNYEAVAGEELPDFIEPLLTASFEPDRHGHIREDIDSEIFMGQLFKLFPEYKIPLAKVFLSRHANGVEILEAAEHDPEVAKFLFSHERIVFDALSHTRFVDVSRPDDYLFSYDQLHFMQTGLEVNPDRADELLQFFKARGTPREELLYISVAYPEIVKSMLGRPLSEDATGSITWNAIKYNYQETALLFATDKASVIALGTDAALLENWDFLERLLREYPEVTPEEILEALCERRPRPWAGADYPSYYQPDWSDLYRNGRKRKAVIAFAERYSIDLAQRNIDPSRY